jgi:hypothetical protein
MGRPAAIGPPELEEELLAEEDVGRGHRLGVVEQLARRLAPEAAQPGLPGDAEFRRRNRDQGGDRGAARNAERLAPGRVGKEDRDLAQIERPATDGKGGTPREVGNEAQPQWLGDEDEVLGSEEVRLREAVQEKMPIVDRDREPTPRALVAVASLAREEAGRLGGAPLAAGLGCSRARTSISPMAVTF